MIAVWLILFSIVYWAMVIGALSIIEYLSARRGRGKPSDP
jgi:hypothetical protein